MKDPTSTKTTGRRLVLAATFIIPGVLVAGFLFLLVSFQGGIETTVANLALLLPVGYAFAAGMVASVNPCGVLLLPYYISYQLGTEETDFYQLSAARRVLKVLLLGGVTTVGFIVIFAVVGSIISAGGRWLINVFPYAGLVIGLAMIAVGLWLLVTHKTFGIMAASRVAISPQRNLGNVFLFGVIYAVGSLSCTLPIFLVVVGSSLASKDLFFSLAQFIGYALGMGTIIFIVAIGTAVFRQAMAKWVRHLIPYVHRVSALFLMGAGVYLIYYWVFQAGLF
jgi:cytochrome c biogenesis protein CcdA